MDSHSIWLTGRFLSRRDWLWEEGVTVTKGGRNSLSSFFTSALKDLCKIIMGNHKLCYQNAVPENHIQRQGDQFQLLSVICIFSHCHACLVLSLASWPHFPLFYSVNWSSFFHNMLLHFFFLSIWPGCFITYLRICYLDTWQAGWAQVQLHWRGMAQLHCGPSFEDCSDNSGSAVENVAAYSGK